MELFIGRLSRNTTQSHLRSFLKGFAKHARVRIVQARDSDKDVIRYAIVEIDSERLARKAIKRFDHQELDGRNVRVREYGHRSRYNERRNGGGAHGIRTTLERRGPDRRRFRPLVEKNDEPEFSAYANLATKRV